MITFSGRGILLDIEGTTSSIRFVYDVMFPYARRKLEAYLRDHWGTPELDHTCELIANDAGFESAASWLVEADSDERQRLVYDEVSRQMNEDLKTTGLKSLQGMIWQDGFESGEMQAHVYDDVPPALARWKERGIDIRIYSSGSIKAQKLFFGHTARGNLLSVFQGHYDTTTGAKREAQSYATIASDFGLPASEILFLSDVAAELDAARDSDMQTGLSIRDGNTPVDEGHGHPVIRTFGEIQFPDSA